MRGFKIARTIDGEYIKRDLMINQFSKDSEVIRNNVEAVCQVIRGELNYNCNLGIPISSKKEEKDLAIANQILKVNGIKRIKQFESKVEDRKYSASIVVETVYSDNLEVNI